MKKIKNLKKRLIKYVVDKLTTSRKPNEKNSPVKLDYCLNMHTNA